MLRITRVDGNDAVTLKLEGKLLSPWCDEIRTAIHDVERPDRAVIMDLVDTSYADHDGIRLINDLLARGVVLGRCSSFISELLQKEKA